MISGSPLLWLPFSLGAGIVAGWYLRNYALLILLVLTVLLSPFLSGRGPEEGRKRVGFLCFFILGLLFGSGEGWRAARQRQLIQVYQGRTVDLVGTVLETPAPWRGGVRFLLRVEEVAGEQLAGQPRLEVFSFQGGDYAYGQRLALRGRVFGDAPGPGSAWARDRVVGGLLSEGQAEERGEGEVSVLGRLVHSCQRKLLRVGEATLPPKEAALLHGMLLGRREPALPTYNFERVGVAHLLSVSGLHLTFWLGLFWGLGKSFRLPDRVLGILAIPAVALFVLIAGGGAPALRAGIMTLLALFGDLTHRPARGPHLLAVAAIAILLLRPLEVFALGFWLSFAACAGLLIIYPRWEQAFSVYPWFVKSRGFFLSLAAQLMVTPLLSKVYGGVSLMAPVANLLLVPLGGLIVQIGLVAALAGLFFFPLARLLNAGNAVLIKLFQELITLLAKLPGYLSFPPWPWLAVGASYGVIFLLTWGLAVNPVTKKRRLPLFYILLVLVLIGLLVVGAYLVRDLRPSLQMVFFDVGQGDAALITVPGDFHILVDGGEAAAYQREIGPYLQAQGIRKLDLVVLTHAHEDHLGGIVRLLEDGRIQVDRILESGFPHSTRLYQRFLQLVLEKEIPLQQGVRGTRLQVGELKGLVLNPSPAYLTGDSEVNNNSLVLLWDYHGVRFLLTGDVETLGESALLTAYGEGLRANLLKVAHHGSSTGTGQAFLEKVRPELAVISVGAGNSFGHPGEDVLARLTQAGVKVYRTDQAGRLKFTIQPGRAGRPVEVRVEREAER
ncbi:MAG TPA: DNA internalization-related competence protein ComEC/Rec2 [Capillibacterium sp.]